MEAISSLVKFVFPFICLLILVFSCNGHAQMVDCLESDREALIDFRQGLIDPKNRLSTWQGTNCCQWQGIACDNKTGAVIMVDLRNPYPLSSDSSVNDRYGFWNLSGDLRPSITKLKSLRYLDLSLNTFIGIPIPTFFNSWKNLQYLNLSNSGFRGVIPSNLGNITSLQHLDVSDRSFWGLSARSLDWVTGLVSLRYLAMRGVNLTELGSAWIEPLSKLPHLSELYLPSCSLSGSISSPVSVNFTSLAVIDLSFNSFGSNFPGWIVNLSTLESIDFSFSYMFGKLPPNLSEMPNLKSLKLVFTNISQSCSEIISGSWRKLQVLDLTFTFLNGEIPSSLGNLTSLTYLSLYWNNISGQIPSSIGNLCNMEYLSLRFNNLTGNIPEILEGIENCPSKSSFPRLQNLVLSSNKLISKLPNWLSELENLVVLDLEYNSLQGPIPSLVNLKHLAEIRLAENELNGTLPDFFGQLSELSRCEVTNNHLTGIISEEHFTKLRKLKTLDLSGNSFIFNLSTNWIPPFQVESLHIDSCYLGSFPTWLKSQSSIVYLSFSNASISGSVPNWFWDMSANLKSLNASFNKIQGNLPNPLKLAPSANIDLSSNLFHGDIPLPNVPLSLLDLSSNQFSGPIPKALGPLLAKARFLSLSGNQLDGQIPVSLGEMLFAVVIDLSRNNLRGKIPSSIGNCSSLKVLDLQSNNLSGELPGSFRHLNLVQTLNLNDNEFSGEISSSLYNLSNLENLDLGNNRLTGNIPSWIGDVFPNLRILRLRSNNLEGEIPPSLSNLTSLQILDLAENKLIGTVPASFINLKAMAQPQLTNHYLFYGMSWRHYYEESIEVNMKGQTLTFTKTLSILTSIDLSGNNLHGAIPVELTSLEGLRALNLSRNNFTGQIPESISELNQLLSLDLSSNELNGSIPSAISSLSSLGYLNLSNNNFSGEIPYTGHLTTFEAPFFAGNPFLCGAPLDVKCTVIDSDKRKRTNEDDGNRDDFIDKWFYLSIGLGFAAGILVPYFVMAIIRSWSHHYFLLVDSTVNRLLH